MDGQQEKSALVHYEGKWYRPTEAVVLNNRAGKVWMGRRTRKRVKDLWEFIGGGVYPSEEIKGAALRESHEEAGLKEGAVTFIAAARFFPYIPFLDVPESFGHLKNGLPDRCGKLVRVSYYFVPAGTEFDLNSGHNGQEQEFDKWDYFSPMDVVRYVPPAAQEAYGQILKMGLPMTRFLETRKANATSEDALVGEIQKEIFKPQNVGKHALTRTLPTFPGDFMSSDEYRERFGRDGMVLPGGPKTAVPAP